MNLVRFAAKARSPPRPRLRRPSRPGARPLPAAQAAQQGSAEAKGAKAAAAAEEEEEEEEGGCASPYEAVLAHLRSLAPAAADLEIRGLGDDRSLGALERMLRFFEWALRARQSFELVQAHLHLTLRLHGDPPPLPCLPRRDAS